MMNSDNKQRIDAARDVLVGIVPDPKGQVEQITTALIYKYLAEQDEIAANIPGGRRSYFVGKYAKFSWAKILSPTLEGDKQLSLYRDAMESMGANPKLPEIFRQMLRGAHSPFRDARVLKLFLKEINELDCRHTEDLGNAYEHLLSIMGTQGDAGQFRTPRNIINFIVAVVNPQIGERILDPACGSAGFLVAAHEHIIKANTDKKPGDKLSTTQKRNLPKSISGYDIDPGMTRLAMVNLYLHGAKEPKVRVYDTLSDDALWSERYDVILANPPFMTPKGGIQPHDKFAVIAKRAEVLFVDYIAEHLSPQGRAGIIVPEGIVSKLSELAYKELRKNLVEQWGLYAVVSLPYGIFKPYTGVKTSVLFLDRKRKNSTSILFIKVENDGFDLGAKRMPIDKNDLPEAKEIIYAYGKNASIGDNRMLVVDKKKISDDGEYSFVSEKYRKVKGYTNAKYPMVKLGDVADIVAGQSPESKYYNDKEKGTPFYQGKTAFTEKYLGDPSVWTTKITRIAVKGNILMSVRAPVGPVNVAVQEICIGRGLAAIQSNEKKLLQEYLFHILKNMESKISGNIGATFPSINKKDIEKIIIPLPSLEAQERISTEINAYKKVRDNAQAVVDNWRPVININPDWQMVKLENLCEILDNKRKPITKSDRKAGKYPYYGATGILDYVNGYIFDEKLVLIGEDGAKWNSGDSTAFIATGKYWVNNHAHVLKPDRSKILDEILVEFVNMADLTPHITGVTVPKLNQGKLKSILIPIPPLEEQKRIAEEIESEQQAVNGCRVLVDKMEHKIADKIAEVWKAKK